MNFLPHFLAPLPAAIAAAIALPLLFLLYFLKLRRRELAVPSTLLWRKAIQDLQVNAPFQKLRRNLLLLLQLLLLLALLLALARPVMNYTPGAGSVTVILIDRSASMAATDGQGGGKTRLDEAKRRAKELVGTLGRNATAMVIAFDQTAETVQGFTSDARALDNAIDSVAQTDRPTKLKLAYQLADAQTAYIPEENRSSAAKPDVRLFSDGRALDVGSVALHADLHYERVGSDKTANLAVVALSAKRNYDRPEQVQVFARLANYGPDPARNVGVQLRVDGQVRSAGVANLLPDRYTDDERRAAVAAGFAPKESVEFPDLELASAATIRVEQTATENDALAADDSATLVVPPPKILSVLLVSDGNFFLEKALAAQRLKTFDRESPRQYAAQMNGGGGKLPQAYDVVVFDRTVPDRLPPTGAFVFFGGYPPGGGLKVATDAGGQPLITTDNFVLDWDREHPILRGLSLGKLYAAHAYKLQPTLDDKVLIDGTNGPLLVLHPEGRGVDLVCPFDVIDSNWPLRRPWPAFIYQALQYLALGSDLGVRPSYAPGTSLRLPRAALEKLSPVPESITLTGPNGYRQQVKVPPTGDFVLPALDHVGMYATQPPVAQYESIAVNLLDANESNTLPAASAPGGGGVQAAAASPGKARLELWWWLVAVAALPLLLVEWWVYTRRVHL